MPLALAALLAGCAAERPARDFDAVRTIAAERLHAEVTWRGAEARPDVRALLDTELTPGRAVQIALANNPALQAVYERVGLAQADYLDATLLPNPVVHLAARLPDRPPSATTIEFSILGNLVDLLMRPDRTRMSALGVDAAVLDVSAEVLRFAGDVEVAYFEHLGTLHKQTALRELATSSANSAAAAHRLQDAGNLSILAAAREDALAEQATLAALRSEVDVATTRARLARLLGLGAAEATLHMPAGLPEPPATPPLPETPAALARAQRLDLQAARAAVEARAAAHRITLDWRWLNGVQLGMIGERSADRQLTVGPGADVELPFFRRHQGEAARTEAELRQKQQELAALALDIENGAELAARHVRQQHAIATRYQARVLPLEHRIEALTRQQIELMLAGTFELAAARKDLLVTQSEYIDALTAYWIAEAELRRALGGALEAPAASSKP
ncbi:MAG: TolC family protein [Gammaproteobacteria bacterium]|nr:TolC family protein [Gammaproteobacteria bacterium]